LFESSLQFADSIQREFLLKDLFQQENLRQFSRQIPKLLSDHGVFINPENLSGFGLDPLYINPIKPNGSDSFGGMIQRPSIEEIEAMLENATPKLTCEGEEYQIAQKTDA